LSEDQHSALTCAVNVISIEDTRDRAEVKNEHQQHRTILLPATTREDRPKSWSQDMQRGARVRLPSCSSSCDHDGAID
jgi:hypothetical protein